MKRLKQTDYPVIALTHPGMKGKNNEDSFGVASFSQGWLGARPVLLAVLSDGIGGHRAGEVASELAVEQISRTVQNSDGRDPLRVLREAIQAASQAIRDQAARVVEQAGMGATCACVWIVGDQLYTATVGDSRLYLLREGRLQRLSTDHTWIQEALERNLLQPEQINGHPNAHVIRRYLGSPNPPDVDFRQKHQEGEDDDSARANQGSQLRVGDLLLLTSDGLTDLVSDEEILAAYQAKPPETAGRELIDLANTRGGHDNITLLAVQVPASPRPRRALPVSMRTLGVGCGAILATALLALGLAAGWWWLGRQAVPPLTVTQSPLVTAPLATGTQAEPAAATVTPGPTLTLSAFRTATATTAVSLPLDSGVTLTPWPTNTPTK
jgi:PPM family protein phosphatase